MERGGFRGAFLSGRTERRNGNPQLAHHRDRHDSIPLVTTCNLFSLINFITMKEKILQMSREELVDFLVENWADFVRKLPTGREKEFFNLHPDLHTVENMRAVALELIGQ